MSSILIKSTKIEFPCFGANILSRYPLLLTHKQVFFNKIQRYTTFYYKPYAIEVYLSCHCLTETKHPVCSNRFSGI